MLDAYRKRFEEERSITLTLRVRPNARATKVLGALEDGSVKMDVKAVPEDGRANEEIARFLAEEFDVPLASVAVLSGHRGRLKIVRVTR